jgi:hypothetical protein
MIGGDLTSYFTISTILTADHVLNLSVMAAAIHKRKWENEIS